MNRREFLTQLILGSAMAALAARAVAKPKLLPSIDLGIGSRKIVFISDIHLSADASTSWIKDHIESLADFLQSLQSREDVTELVILGDLLDDWMVPIEAPPSTFQQILEATHNQPVVDALKDICDNSSIKVTYVTGNHDLLSFDPDAQEVIKDTFPGIIIVSKEPGLGAYFIDEVVWAEHGHRYSLFNSPDIWSHPGSHLPLGYFITRLVASQSELTKTIYNSPEIIEEIVINQLVNLIQSSDRDRFIAAVFTAIARWAGKGPLDEFTMDGKDGFTPDPTVSDITTWYSPIMSQWSKHQNIVLPDLALLNELGYMINTAQLLFTMPRRIKTFFPFKPRIVLFGHTHKPLFWQGIGLRSTIYANTGTWIDGKPMTWVEIDIQEKRFHRRSYTVSLWYEGQTKPSQSGTIIVPGA